MPLWSAIPFAGLVLSIGLLPPAAERFWSRNYHIVSAFWIIVFAAPFLFFLPRTAIELIFEALVDNYLPFIILLASLYVVAGGIVVRGVPHGSPRINTLLLAVGAALASLLGAAGAAMVMIRPLLRANATRRHKAHVVVFFIFLVCNIGGALTPFANPPLLLGYLHGVPFLWNLSLLPHVLTSVAILLGLFFAVDSYWAKRETPDLHEHAPAGRLRIKGVRNLAFLAGIIAVMVGADMAKLGSVTILGIPVHAERVLRDALTFLLGVSSFLTTPRKIHVENNFHWEPIREVAWLFAGIFITMVPLLAALKQGEAGPAAPLLAAMSTPARWFWSAGLLSSVLDNAPSYLLFFQSALGRVAPQASEQAAVAQLVGGHSPTLAAIAAGSVFMGALTYIGNAPNLLVRATAQHAGVVMPSFFGYLFKWAVPILFPLFFFLTVVFFR